MESLVRFLILLNGSSFLHEYGSVRFGLMLAYKKHWRRACVGFSQYIPQSHWPTHGIVQHMMHCSKSIMMPVQIKLKPL